MESKYNGLTALRGWRRVTADLSCGEQIMVSVVGLIQVLKVVDQRLFSPRRYRKFHCSNMRAVRTVNM